MSTIPSKLPPIALTCWITTLALDRSPPPPVQTVTFGLG